MLFSLVEELETRLDDPLAGQALDHLTIKLRAYFDAHFENEAAFMQQTAYPGAEGHIAAHKEFLERFEVLAAEIHSSHPNKATELLTALKQWLTTHIAGTDRDLGEYLTRLGVVVTPSVFPEL